MKQTELMARVMAGKTTTVATVHCCKLEPLNLRNKDTGKQRVAHIEKISVLTDDGMGIIENWLPDDKSPEAWVPPCKKGDRLAIFSKSQMVIQGVAKYSGAFEKLTD